MANLGGSSTPAITLSKSASSSLILNLYPCFQYVLTGTNASFLCTLIFSLCSALTHSGASKLFRPGSFRIARKARAR